MNRPFSYFLTLCSLEFLLNGDIILLSNLYIQFQAMENNRDDFSSVVKDVLAKRVGYLCSNCRQPTVGANQVPTKATSFGIDAHITAAAPGGPRFNADLMPEERRDIGNGIWLCGNCSILIDKDSLKYTVDILYEWKLKAEEESRQKLNGTFKGASIPVAKSINPILEADLVGGGRSRSPRGYSNKNPIEMHEGQLVMVPGLKPIIYWELGWRYKLAIINNSAYPAYNVKIESIGGTHFSEMPPIQKVNNIAPLQSMDLDVKFNDWIKSDHVAADALIKPKYPAKFENLILKLTYEDEDRDTYHTLIHFVQGEIVNDKVK